MPGGGHLPPSSAEMNFRPPPHVSATWGGRAFQMKNTEATNMKLAATRLARAAQRSVVAPGANRGCQLDETRQYGKLPGIRETKTPFSSSM